MSPVATTSPATVDGADVNATRNLTKLPEPDYAGHPAYGRLFGTPSLASQAKSVAQLLPWMGLVLVKRAMLFERLPPLEDYGGPMASGFAVRVAAIPRYAPVVFRGLAERFRTTRKSVVAGVSARYEAMRRDGAVGVRFMPGEIDAIRREVAGPLSELDKRRKTAEKRTFEGNQIWLNRQRNRGLYELLDRVMASNGVKADAAAYLGRPVTIQHITLQVNDAKDGFHHNKFADVGVPDPQTNYMHVDTTDEILKFMIYLNEVTPENGPFCYVLGSAGLLTGWFEGIVRRAVDRSGLSGYSPSTRQMFWALPKALRRKCTFGSDLEDGSPEVKALIDAEHRFTSEDGDAILFDPLGIHRGALVRERERERQIMIVTIA